MSRSARRVVRTDTHVVGWLEMHSRRGIANPSELDIRREGNEVAVQVIDQDYVWSAAVRYSILSHSAFFTCTRNQLASLYILDFPFVLVPTTLCYCAFII
ncbi:hypothetical protein NEOLEDRAFT_321044 [Neolentinus lepideus HHB14362 ss-1]|uniref:Uncharacterized protein n=1 Tax=Neolentinus lepideus HHB14362 ss-1 TaxID=1314782 RepID=A0A165VVG9_9AGAM|nr:hypothetical protein NEOLEDRAFT_321044 [Neolentinus lepideus HHB14362 ss-1]